MITRNEGIHGILYKKYRLANNKTCDIYIYILYLLINDEILSFENLLHEYYKIKRLKLFYLNKQDTNKKE